MRFFWTQFICTLSLRLKSGKNWLSLLLLPAMILAVTAMLPRTEASTLVTVGVVLPEEGAEDFWSLLQQQNSGLLTFVEAEPETVDRNVAAGQWDCGLILPEDFSARLETLDLRRLIRLRIGAGSAVYPMVQESVSACLAQLAGPHIAKEYLLESGIVPLAQMPEAEPRLQGVLGDQDRVLVSMKTLGGRGLEVPELTSRGVARFLCWLVAAVILVRMVFGAADLGRWSNSPAVQRMAPLRCTTLLLSGRAAADALLIAVSGWLSVAVLKGGIQASLAVTAYVLFWLGASVLLARFPRVHPVLPVVLPFGVVISFLLSPVLMDISQIFPAIAGVSRYLPETLFLRAWSGDGKALAALLAAGAFWLLCALGMDRRNTAEHK